MFATLAFFTALFMSLLPAFAAPVPKNNGLAKRTYSGDGTYYVVGLGACGWTSVSTDYVVALATEDYDSGSHCGDIVSITYDGTTSSATVVDECEGCSSGDLDMSESLFETFTTLSVGRFEMSWEYSDSSSSSATSVATSTSSSSDPSPSSADSASQASVSVGVGIGAATPSSAS